MKCKLFCIGELGDTDVAILLLDIGMPEMDI